MIIPLLDIVSTHIPPLHNHLLPITVLRQSENFVHPLFVIRSSFRSLVTSLWTETSPHLDLLFPTMITIVRLLIIPVVWSTPTENSLHKYFWWRSISLRFDRYGQDRLAIMKSTIGQRTA